MIVVSFLIHYDCSLIPNLIEKNIHVYILVDEEQILKILGYVPQDRII